MKIHVNPSRNPVSFLFGLACGCGLLPGIASAATYTWTGGTGNWDTTTPNWSGAGSTWPLLGADNDAVFGGSAGTVTITSPNLVANDLTFNASGYVVGGGRLALFGATPNLTVGAGLSATLNANVAGTVGLTKAGAGTLTLGGVTTYAGTTTAAAGTLAVGTGGRIRNSNQVFVGGTGTGTLTVSGGHLYSDTGSVFGLNIGSAANQPGVVNISSGTLTLGNAGGGIVMGQGGTGATATFNQTGGAVGIGAGLYLANGGGGNTSTFNQSGGTFATGGTVRVGQTAGGTGVFNLSGGTFNQPNNALFYIGENGNGTLTVSGSGVLNSGSELWLGTGANSAGTLNLNGGVVNHSGIILVVGGNNGNITARFNQTGGTYNLTGSNGIYIGNSNGTAGTMNLSGGVFNHAGAPSGENRIRVGSNTGGSGTLNVSGSAALVTNAEMWIGGAAGTGAGTLNLSGGSITQGGQYFVVGNSATSSTYNQTGGTYLFTGVNGSYIGNGSSGAGTMNVSGGTFTQTQNLFRLGQNGSAQGTVNLGGGGGAAVMTLPTLTFGANSASAAGTFNLLANGTLTAATINKAAGAGTFNFNGGTLRPSGANAAFMTGLTAANVQAGGAVIDTASHNITVGQPLLAASPSGGLTKNGYGTLTLSGASTYTGSTVVNTGVANVTGSLASPTLDLGVSYAGSAPSAAGLLILAGTPSLAGRTLTTHTFSGTAASGTDYLAPILSLPGGFTGSPSVTAPGVANQSIQRIGNTYFLTNTGGSHYLWNDAASASPIADGVALNTTWDAATATSWRQSDDLTDTNVAWGGAGETAHFGVANGAAGAITVSGTVSAAGLAFHPTGSGTYTLSGGTIAFGAGNGRISAEGTSAGIGSALTGSAGLTKVGTGSITLSGGNSYTGGTVVSQGEIRSQGNAATQGTITLGDTSTGANNVAWLFNGGGTPSNPIVVSSQGTGLATLGSFSAGLSTVHSGTVNLNRPTIFSDATGDRTTFSGQISGNPGTITITGTRITFGNAGNNFTGNVVIGAGSIYQNDSPTALPSGTSVDALGTFRLNNGGTHAINALTGPGAVNIIAGGVATLSVGNANGSGTHAGVISNGTAALSLVKNGTGTQILTGSSTYTGSTTVNGGVLQIGDGTTTGVINSTSGITIGAAGTLRWHRSNTGVAATNNHSGSGTMHLLGTNAPGALSQSDYLLTSQNNTGFTGTLVAERARVRASQADDFGSATLRVERGGQFLIDAIPSFANNIVINDATGWYEASALNLSALRFAGTVAHTGNITLNQTARGLPGDNNGQNTVITAYTTSDVTLSGIIGGAGDFSMNRYTSWNGGATQDVQIRLAGNQSNIYTGDTVVNGQGSRASLWLQKTGGAVAIPANTTVYLGNGTGGQANLRMGADNQFGSGVVLDFANASGQWMRFDLLGTSQTVAGLITGNLSTQGSGVVQNSGASLAGPGGTSTLTLDGSGTYVFNGHMRNIDNVGTGVLALSKTGGGMQTLAGNVISYTGATTVSGGTLELRNTTAFNSASIANTAAVRFYADGNNAMAVPSVLTGGGSWTVDGPGGGTLFQNRVVLRGVNSSSASGIDVVNGGKLWLDRNNNSIADSVVVNLATSASSFTLYSDATPANQVAETIGGLSGSGSVFGYLGGGTVHPALTVGGGNVSATFTGTISDQNGSLLSITKTGTGTQTLVSAGNTYGGATTINQGTLVAGGGGAIGNNSAVTLANDATAQLQVTASETVGSLGGGGAAGGNVDIQGNTLTAGGNNGSTTYAGVLSGVGGSLVKDGTGTMTLSNGANSFSGKVSVRNGTLVAAAATGSRGLGSPAAGVDSITLGAPGSAGTLAVSGGSLTLGPGRGIALAGTGGTLDVGTGLTVALDGGISGNVVGSTFTKAGDGTFNLTGGSQINALVVSGGVYEQLAGVSEIISTTTGLSISNGATYRLSGGTLRTDRITAAGTGAFVWGSATLSARSTLGNLGVTDHSAPTYQAVRTGLTTPVTADIATSAGSVWALHGSPTLYLNDGVRFNNWAVDGDLNLSAAGDTLELEINPYLLRPFSSAGLGATETGSLPLITWTGAFGGGTFDSVTGVVASGVGFTESLFPVADPTLLDANSWYIEYDAADSTIWFHYKVSGYVPEPASFGMLAAGALGLRLLRTLRVQRRRVTDATV